MATMKMIVFNVEQGQCVYIRTAEDYGLLIDCGKSSAEAVQSPAQWLADNEMASLKHYEGHALAGLIVTHPHEGHVADMEAVTARLSPAAVYRSVGDGVTTLPDLGASIKLFALSPGEAEALGGDEHQVINNQSVVTVVSYKSPEGYAWKVVVAGDNEANGLQALLAKQEFCDEIAEADFFVTPYHGQEAGFCADLFKVMGKPIANISSTRSQDKSSDSKYRKLAQGVKFPDGTRKDFITRDDGNITVEMHSDGRFDVWLFTP